MRRGTRSVPAAAMLCALLRAQSPLSELDPNPTGGLGGGPTANPAEYASIARPVVAVERVRLKAVDAEVRRDAAARLGQLGAGALPAFDDLVAALGDPQRAVVGEAVRALAAIVSRDDDELLARLEKLAREPDARAAAGAASALAAMRLRRESTAALLTDLVEHDDYDLRMTALQGLLCVGPCAKRSVATLAATISDPAEPEEVRIAAIECLRRFGAAGLPATQEVAAAVPDRRAGAAAARWMHDRGGRVESFAPALFASFDGRVEDLVDFDRQFEIARAIEPVASKSGVAEAFLRATLGHRDAAIRDEAAYRAGRDQGRSTGLCPDLARLALFDPEARVRARAAAALGLVGEADVLTIDALLRALRDPAARFDAALSLGLRAPDVENTVGALASNPALLPEERAALYFAAARLDPTAPVFRLRLAEILGGNDEFARGCALVFFGVLRDAPAEADDALARALVDPRFEIRETARWTVARTRPSGAHGRALASLRGEAGGALLPYWLAATKWWSITPNDWEMISALGDLRHRARFEAPRKRPDADPPREFGRDDDAIRRAAIDPDARVRELAALRAAELAAASPWLAPLMRRLLADRSRRVRLAAVRAVAAVGGEPEVATPALAALLKDPSWRVRQAAAEALKALRPSDDRTLDALARASADPVAAVRETASAARVAYRSPAPAVPPAPSAQRR